MATATFDIKTEATRTLFAGVGAADLAVEALRDYLAEFSAKATEVQKNLADLEYTPATLRAQATTLVDSLTNDAKATRVAFEARMAELQTEMQSVLNGNAATVNDAYADLAKRGELLVSRIRKQESTQATAASAKTTVAKAKTTRTQATKAATSTKTAAKKAAKSATTTAKKRSSTAASSAKATATAAKKTAAHAVDAVVDAAEKVGD